MSGLRTASILVGGLLVLGALGVGAVDGFHAAKNWSALGPLPPGEPVPPFRLAKLEGGTFSQSDLRGQVTVMTFWATWCGACKGELGDLDEIDDRFADRDVQFVAVNWEGVRAEPARLRAHVQGYVRARDLGLPVAIDDGTMARQLRVGPIPHTVIFDRQGVLRYIHQGRVTSSTILEEIEELSAR